jgi:site-specific recombinase XerC
MLNDGRSVRVVQEILGHASLDTMLVYTTPGLEEQIAAVRRTQDGAAAPQAGPRLEYDEEAMNLLFGDDR